MREAIFVLDAHDRVVDLNLAARRLVNFKASKAVGRPFAEVFRAWPELVERCRDSLEVEEEVIASEGEAPRYYGLRITPLYRRSGHLVVTGRLLVLQDITKYVQAEKALKESEGRFRSIFAEVPVGIAVVDLEGHLLQVNESFSEMLGYGAQELIGFSHRFPYHFTSTSRGFCLVDRPS